MSTSEETPKEPDGAHAPPSEQQQFADSLRQAGLSDREVRLWLTTTPKQSYSEHLRNALDWQHQFGDAELAVMWFKASLPVSDALASHRVGFTPAEARDIHARVFLAAMANSTSAPVPSEDAWRSSGLPAKWISACLDAGVTTVDAAIRLHETSKR